jgi:excinuclease UvrABC nuclease subunit
MRNLLNVPSKSGVYELGNYKGVVVYIGSSHFGENIRGRLNYHKNNKPSSVRLFRYQLTGLFDSALTLEQLHCEAFKEAYGRLPSLQQRMPRGYTPLF